MNNQEQDKLQWKDALTQGAIAGVIFLPQVQDLLMGFTQRNELIVFAISLVIFYIINYMYFKNIWLDYDYNPETKRTMQYLPDSNEADYINKQLLMNTGLVAILFNNWTLNKIREFTNIGENMVILTDAIIYSVVMKSFFSFMEEN